MVHHLIPVAYAPLNTNLDDNHNAEGPVVQSPRLISEGVRRTVVVSHWAVAMVAVTLLPVVTEAQQEGPPESTSAVLSGTAFDSTRTEPLHGAEVRLLGTEISASTDVGGTYRLEILGSGTYEVRLEHPRAGELGIEALPTREIEVEAGESYELDLAIPGWSTLAMWQCGRQPGSMGTGVLGGDVVATGSVEPIEGVTVRVRTRTNGDPDQEPETWESESGPDGRFLFCDLPPDVPLVASPMLAGLSGGARDVRLSADAAGVLTLRLGIGPVGMLRGTVEQAGSGEPIEAARIRVQGPEGLTEELVTDENGIFHLHDAPGGSYRVEVSHLTFRDLEDPVEVEVLEGQTTTVTVRLRRDAIALDPVAVVVDANRPTWGPLVDVYDRRDRFEALGLGTFIGRDVLENPGASRLSVLISSRAPGVRLVPTGPFRNTLRIHRQNDCSPSYYVDGIRQRGLDGGIDRYFTPGQVEMIEVYRGISQLPGEFADNHARRCGAIAIWTRRGR